MDRNNRTFIYATRIANDRYQLDPLMAKYGCSTIPRFLEKVLGMTLPEMHDAAIGQGIATSTWVDLSLHQLFPDRWPNKPRMISRRGRKIDTSPKLVGGNVRYRPVIYLRPEVYEYWLARAKAMPREMELADLIVDLLHRNYDKAMVAKATQPQPTP